MLGVKYTVYERMESATKDGVVVEAADAKEAANKRAQKLDLADGTELLVLVQYPSAPTGGFIVIFKVERGLRVVHVS